MQGTESHCEVAAGLLLFFFLVPPDTATEIISSANVSVALAEPPAECATWPEFDNSHVVHDLPDIMALSYRVLVQEIICPGGRLPSTLCMAFLSRTTGMQAPPWLQQ